MVPSLSRVCVAKIVNEITLFCQGTDFQELGKYSRIAGPLQNLPSTCIEAVFNYVITTGKLSPAWLSVLIVSHLKAIDFTSYPSAIDDALFKTLLFRCQHLEKLVIPYCKKISNQSLCSLLKQNPSLLTLDISNKLIPTIDQTVLKTLVMSCRFLTTLKLSDYRVDDPKCLLVLCGRKVISKSPLSPVCSNSETKQQGFLVGEIKDVLNSDLSRTVDDELVDRVNDILLHDDHISEVDANEVRQHGERACNDGGSNNGSGGTSACDVKDINAEYGLALEHNSSVPSNVDEEDDVLERDHKEEENQRGRELSSDDGDLNDDDFYENDSQVLPLEVEDHSAEFGCLELETLWLENINLTDQVAAVLFQNLLRLRDINLSDTDICNPWRLLDPSNSSHLNYLQDLDVKSTALSRTALQMIPKFHPDLQRLSISSTTLPPPTYSNIAQLKGIAELELIGGQFYPCEPEVIFVEGINPAVSGVGEHLQSLNLTYFAHVKFSEIVLNCPRIQHLDLSYTDIFISYPCPPIGQHCPNLTSLNMGYAQITAKDASLQPVSEDKVTQQMIGEPPVLEELHLCGLVISDEGIENMYRSAEYPLRILNVSRCKQLTISGIEHLWRKCPFLTSIDITHCKKITHNTYKTFEKTCKERPFFRMEGTIQWK